MAQVPLSPATLSRLNALFQHADRGAAHALLVEQCGSNLPFCDDYDSEALERIRFAALKLSEGQLPALRSAVRLAQTDWRDLLVAADFADDVEAHRSWFPA